MSRKWFLALALSLGLNGGMFWVQLSSRGGPLPRPPWAESRRFRGERRPPRPPDPARLVTLHLKRMDERLELAAGKRAEIETLLREALPRVVEGHERVREAREAITDAYRSDSLDDARFRDLVRALNGRQTTLDSATAELMLAEARLLTPEQRERYAGFLPWGGPERGDRSSGRAARRR
jgi:hypothetical protein